MPACNGSGDAFMQSLTFDTILQAMKSKQQIRCEYQGSRLDICFHYIGRGADGAEKAIGFQFAGESSAGHPSGGHWSCVEINQLRSVRPQGGPWFTGSNHEKPPTCLRTVLFEVTV